MKYFAIAVSTLLLMICSFSAPTLSAAATRNRGAEIRSAITAYIEQKTAGSDFSVKIKRMSFPEVELPAEMNPDYEIISPAAWEGWDSVNISVVARDGERIVRNIPVRVEIEAKAEMVVASRQIDSGALLTADDLLIKMSDVAPTKGHYMKNMDMAVGKKTKHSLRANAALRIDHLQKVPVIRSGQLVTIIVESAQMKLSVTGKAKGDGAVGDTIVVQNMSSLKEFPARIKDSNTVQVPF